MPISRDRLSDPGTGGGESGDRQGDLGGGWTSARLSGVDREHLTQQVSGRPVGHQGAEMRLKLFLFRCQSAMRWSSNAMSWRIVFRIIQIIRL
jgi:hypothetical protein